MYQKIRWFFLENLILKFILNRSNFKCTPSPAPSIAFQVYCEKKSFFQTHNTEPNGNSAEIISSLHLYLQSLKQNTILKKTTTILRLDF